MRENTIDLAHIFRNSSAAKSSDSAKIAQLESVVTGAKLIAQTAQSIGFFSLSFSHNVAVLQGMYEIERQKIQKLETALQASLQVDLHSNIFDAIFQAHRMDLENLVDEMHKKEVVSQYLEHFIDFCPRGVLRNPKGS